MTSVFYNSSIYLDAPRECVADLKCVKVMAFRCEGMLVLK